MDQNDQLNSEGHDQGPNRSIVAIILEAMQDAPSGTKALLAMFGAVTILAVGMCGAMISAGQYSYAFLSFLAVVACFFAAIQLLRGLVTSGTAPSSRVEEGANGGGFAPQAVGGAGIIEDEAREALRSLAMVKVPLPSSTPVREIHEKMEALRDSVFVWLREEQDVEIEASDIRAHIFIPDYHMISRCGVLALFMPDVWQVNMKGHKDEKFRVRPGQGVAGLAYESEQPQRFVIEDGRWPSELSFDAEQRAMRHPDITWIVGIPLTVPESGPTLGVLGIHGLRVGITSEQAAQLYGKLHYMAAAITARLAMIEQGTFEVRFRSRSK